MFSIERVGGEIDAGEDELAKWVGQRPGLFLPPDNAMTQSFAVVSTWAMDQEYDPAAYSTFFQIADYYLVAHAHAHNFVVVTHEVPAYSPRKIKIPNACIGIGVKCVTPYEMLRTERARFVLGPRG